MDKIYFMNKIYFIHKICRSPVIFFFVFLVPTRNEKQDGNKFIILKKPVFGFFFKESIAL